MLTTGSLVLYKSAPAIVRAFVDQKYEILLESGKTKKVRDKDIVLLCSDTLKDFEFLSFLPTATEEQIGEAVELMEGEAFPLADVAELLFAEVTPNTVWASYLLLTDDVYFYGELDAISARPVEDAQARLQQREEEQARKLERDAFIERLQQATLLPEDREAIQDIVELAHGQRDTSTNLKLAGSQETPTHAHAYLLRSGIWSVRHNPYPARHGIDCTRFLPEELDYEINNEGRRDLTHLDAYAIDDAHSSDPDDAISLDAEGHIWVHVADLGAICTELETLDTLAQEQPANLYIPEGVFPMLPQRITDMLGLGLAETSPALSFCLELTDGKPVLLEIIPSIIRVTRISYQDVELQLGHAPFDALNTYANAFNQFRMEHGARAFNLPDIRIVFDDDNIYIEPVEKLSSRDLVMEYMLMAGMAVAEYAKTHDIPLIYTTQAAPTEPPPESTSIAAQMLQLFKTPRTIRSLEPGEQAGLGLTSYAQITSPLRRYFDWINHRQLRAHISNLPLLDAEALTNLLTNTDHKIGHVRIAERESNLHWKMLYLKQNPDWNGEAHIVDFDGVRYGILLPELALFRKVKLSGSFQPGDIVNVTATTIDIPELDVRFTLSKATERP
jgi:exoribonuclease II